VRARAVRSIAPSPRCPRVGKGAPVAGCRALLQPPPDWAVPRDQTTAGEGLVPPSSLCRGRRSRAIWDGPALTTLKPTVHGPSSVFL
jgi:hypothetical protein